MAHSVSPPAVLISRACYGCSPVFWLRFPQCLQAWITPFVFICCFFILFFSARVGQRFATDPSSFPSHEKRLGQSVVILRREALYSVHAIPCSFFCLIVASVATPWFFSSQEPRVQSIFSQLILTNIVFKVWYVQPCIADPMPRSGTPRSWGCKSFLRCSTSLFSIFCGQSPGRF